MGNIWTPGSDVPKRVVVKATIITAKYHPVEKAIIIAVRLSNGKVKSMPDFPQNHTFRGRPATALTTEEIDREMERTAEAWRKASGRQIKVEVDETELK